VTQHPDGKARKPGPKQMRLVKNYAVMPNYDAWAADMRQVAFDEAIYIEGLKRDKNNDNREVPGPEGSDKATLLWGVNERDGDGNPKLGLSFALMQQPKGAAEHRLERPYEWDNKGEYEMFQDKIDNMLFFFSDATQTVQYAPLSNNMTMKKLSAKRQNKDLADEFEVKRKKVEYRDATAEENAMEEERIQHLLIADDEAWMGTPEE